MDYIAERAARQKKEIETIKPRTFLVDLSDADVDRLAEYAARAGLTMADLLKNFIGDLVDGTYSNGSDERDCADAWYDRCGFSHFAANNVAKLANVDALDTFMDAWDDYQTYVEEVAYRKNMGDHTEEDVAEAEEWLATALKDLQEAMTAAKCEGSLEEVAAEVVAWFDNANKSKGEKVKLSAN